MAVFSSTPAPLPPAPAHEIESLDVLTPADAQLYRSIFAAQKLGDWAGADAAIAKLADKRLMGAVVDDRDQRRATPAGGRVRAASSLSKLRRMGHEDDTAADFSAELSADALPSGSGVLSLARAINSALHHGDPSAARNLLIAAEAERPLVGTFAADAEAAIAAGFFYAGEREQSRALASAAAGAYQPLGLWIRGLIAWEQNDLPVASLSFSRLADHPALNPGPRAAAHFWAYRALSRSGDKKQAYVHLEQAARQPRSFYGMLATQLVARSPAVVRPDAPPAWTQERRSVLAAYAGGWRALALIQVNEISLAEAELLRLNAGEKDQLRQAMLALAALVPMPALSLQLAGLPGNLDGQGFDTASHPLPPWQPKHGFEVDRALIYALARHESRFDPTAISSRGARGLMQIMPETAHGEGATGGNLLDPAYNLALGQKYLRRLASHPQIGDNLMLLLAAYNGGPNKITQWREYETGRQDSKSAHDPLLFMESIPQRETRNYIARVLPHYWAYRARLAEPLTSLKQLAEGVWPRFTLADEAGTRRAEADGFQMAKN